MNCQYSNRFPNYFLIGRERASPLAPLACLKIFRSFRVRLFLKAPHYKSSIVLEAPTDKRHSTKPSYKTVHFRKAHTCYSSLCHYADVEFPKIMSPPPPPPSPSPSRGTLFYPHKTISRLSPALKRRRWGIRQHRASQRVFHVFLHP